MERSRHGLNHVVGRGMQRRYSDRGSMTALA